jgi:hypothetical protein
MSRPGEFIKEEKQKRHGFRGAAEGRNQIHGSSLAAAPLAEGSEEPSARGWATKTVLKKQETEGLLSRISLIIKALFNL